MALTEKKIRNKIFELILSVCTDAKRIRRNPYTQEKSKWIGHFSHEIDIGGGETKVVVHAWLIRRIALKKAVKSGFDQYTFELLGFYGYNFGTESDNSEDKWQELLDRVSDKLTEDDVWEFEDEDDEVTTEEAGFPLIGLIPAGEKAYVNF
ncbi:MAG: hypothetical protein ABWZ66_11820, partial [Pyrinomonadaceae bacterium]